MLTSQFTEHLRIEWAEGNALLSQSIFDERENVVEIGLEQLSELVEAFLNLETLDHGEFRIASNGSGANDILAQVSVTGRGVLIQEDNLGRLSVVFFSAEEALELRDQLTKVVPAGLTERSGTEGYRCISEPRWQPLTAESTFVSVSLDRKVKASIVGKTIDGIQILVADGEEFEIGFEVRVAGKEWNRTATIHSVASEGNGRCRVFLRWGGY